MNKIDRLESQLIGNEQRVKHMLDEIGIYPPLKSYLEKALFEALRTRTILFSGVRRAIDCDPRQEDAILEELMDNLHRIYERTPKTPGEENKDEG